VAGQHDGDGDGRRAAEWKSSEPPTCGIRRDSNPRHPSYPVVPTTLDGPTLLTKPGNGPTSLTKSELNCRRTIGPELARSKVTWFGS
jgi:hypothetical protein